MDHDENEHPDKTGVKLEKIEKVEHKEKFEKLELKEKPEKFEHKEKPEKIEHKEKPEKFEHKEKPEKFEHKEKPEKTEHFEKHLEQKLIAESPLASFQQAVQAGVAPSIHQHVAALEQAVANLKHFITPDLRPDLSHGALKREPDSGESTGG